MLVAWICSSAKARQALTAFDCVGISYSFISHVSLVVKDLEFSSNILSRAVGLVLSIDCVDDYRAASKVALLHKIVAKRHSGIEDQWYSHVGLSDAAIVGLLRCYESSLGTESSDHLGVVH
jgi:hypothetical protein